MFIQTIKAMILADKTKSFKIAAVVLIIIIALIIYLNNNLAARDDIFISDAEGIAISAEDTVAVAVTEKEIFIVVDIEGAVNKPGVVILPDGSRVNDAVEKAGGLAGDADTMNVNLAAKLSDGDKVYIPNEGNENGKEQKTGAQPAGIITSSVSNGASTTPDADGALININTANSQQLQALNGVGPATAQKIIEYRESSGGYKKIEDIMKVSGIGAKTFEKLKDRITV